jgi:hypothetical protein
MALVTRMSSNAQTLSVFPDRLYVTMTKIAQMVQVNFDSILLFNFTILSSF